VTGYHYNDTQLTVMHWSFDNDKRHMTAFRPISEAAHSWTYDNVFWQDIDTIYLYHAAKELSLPDFDHLDAK